MSEMKAEMNVANKRNKEVSCYTYFSLGFTIWICGPWFCFHCFLLLSPTNCYGNSYIIELRFTKAFLFVHFITNF